jgi:exonuclease III
VGILVHKNIYGTNFNLIGQETDEEGNYLLLNIEMDSIKYTIGTVYGPNHDDQLITYTRLRNACLKINNRNVILGGDFNATWDESRVNSNIDVVNMVDIPSRIRTVRLKEIADEIGLTDPFRILYPNKKEYTYIPSALNNMNRSRIDFFLISRHLIANIASCEIPHSLCSTFFDHKQIFLTLGSIKKQVKNVIKDAILKDVETQFHVQTSIMETYLQHR